MIRRDQFDRAARLLAAGQSYRQIQRATRLCRETIARTDRGEIKRPSQCDQCKPEGDRPKVGRCGRCGRRVELPCCACCAERHRARNGPRPIGQVLDELALDLTPRHQARLDDVRAARQAGLPLEEWIAQQTGQGAG